ncbi:MAG: 50S ribosomal protein L15e [Nanoarchaeota archaeon]|nr:50S ribosomal protein L15e [Nanoarchaeota archaeon]
MAKGLYHHLKQAWKNPNQERLRELMVVWRSEEAVIKIDKPTRLDKARILGYKAKKGYVVARVRVKRGGRQRARTNKGRKSKRHTIRKVVQMNYRWIAEIRAQKKYPNLEVLNSYPLSKDGKHYFFEVILVDYERPEIKNDKTINWICKANNRNRVYRGLTSAGKKSRGLRSKSPTNKARPSVRKMYITKKRNKVVHRL